MKKKASFFVMLIRFCFGCVLKMTNKKKLDGEKKVEKERTKIIYIVFFFLLLKNLFNSVVAEMIKI